MYVLFFEECCWLFQSCVGRWRVWKHEGGRKRSQDPFVGGACGICAIPPNESDGYGAFLRIVDISSYYFIFYLRSCSIIWNFFMKVAMVIESSARFVRLMYECLGIVCFFLWYILGFFIWWIWSPSPLSYFSSISIMGILIFLRDNHILQESMLLFAACFVFSFSVDVMFIAHVPN